MDLGGLGLVVLQDAVAVEAEMARIGAHKADHVGRARQILRPALFERGQISRLDAQDLADLIEVEIKLLAPLAQDIADRAGTRHRWWRVIAAAVGKWRLDSLKQAHDGLSLSRHCRAADRVVSNRRAVNALPGAGKIGSRQGIV